MRSTLSRTMIAGTLTTVAVAVTIAASAAYGRSDLNRSPKLGSPNVSRVFVVPPPPSLMAASAAKEYDRLRSAAAAHNRSVSVADRSATVADRSATVAHRSAPVADERSAPGGFDWLSATIGAAAIAGLAL